MHPLGILDVLNDYATARLLMKKRPRRRRVRRNVGPHKVVNVATYRKKVQVLTCAKCARVALTGKKLSVGSCNINHPRPPGWAADTTHA